MRLLRRGAFVAAVAMTMLLCLYVVVVAQLAMVLVTSGSWVGALMGGALLVLPALGAWYVVLEWRLGVAVQRMADRLDAEHGLPIHDGDREANGRLTEAAAEGIFEAARRETEAHPGDWRCWFRVAWAYEANRDRSMARRSMRHAADLFRQEQRVRP